MIVVTIVGGLASSLWVAIQEVGLPVAELIEPPVPVDLPPVPVDLPPVPVDLPPVQRGAGNAAQQPRPASPALEYG
jgi:hypothetical protein